MNSSSPPKKTAEVAVVAPLDRVLTYGIPPALAAELQIGCRVRVPLGRRQVVGYVVGWALDCPDGIKNIVEIIDPEPLFHARHATFYRRAADYYAYPPGEAVRTALPAGLSSPDATPSILKEKVYRAVASAERPAGQRQREIMESIRSSGEASLSQLRSQFDAPHAVLNRLVALGCIAVTETERCRDPFADVAIADHTPVILNSDQQAAMARLEAWLAASPGFHPVLLHGVTGSGKTEVYLRAIACALDQRRQSLVLVPEIALTPQLVSRFRSWFKHRPARLAVLHSGLSDGERYDAWRQVARGEVDVVIGARSAIFAPLPKLGLIVVDEEHDGSYKQSESFRYNARDLALLRGQMDDAVVILGSATPSLATFQRARDGRIACLELPVRTSERPLPEVQLIDLAQHDRGTLLSGALQEALAETLAAGEQALLLLNRRGYAPYLLCHDCGAAQRCPNCDITLTFSKVQRSLRCHYCDYRVPPPNCCGGCGGTQVLPEGIGTERLEEDLQALFPGARLARMDRDTTSRKGAHARLIDRMHAGEIDILIGTQMIAKGHDFPAVTLVGVLNADAALNLPDFRSAERVFSLLSQVAGRAGRGDRPGRVLIQTYAPENYALELVARHDYHGFSDIELAQRSVLSYPPFGHLVNLVLAGNDDAKVRQGADSLAEELAAIGGEVEILGPAPCMLSRLRNKHRVQLLLKAVKRAPLRRMVDHLRSKWRAPAGVALTIDVDPVDMF